MNRMEMNTLTSLVESAEGGGYTLPRELTDAYQTYARVSALTMPETEKLDEHDAALQIVRTVAAGDEPDVAEIAAALEQSSRTDQVDGFGRRALLAAIDQAGLVATTAASDLADTIIAQHLRPALETLNVEVRETADALAGYGLDPHALITATAKVRNAYARLPGLVARRQAIFTARRYANQISHQRPEHDDAGLFGEFANPLSFFPDWTYPARVPQIPAPTDPVERLLWLGGPEATAAEPWLPTVAEQDAAWWRTFGENVERLRANRQSLEGFRAVFS